MAEHAGVSTAYLEQILKGTLLPLRKGDTQRAPRSLGDAAARAIEDAFELGRGWFDNDDTKAMLSPNEMLLLGYFRQIDPEAQGVVLGELQEQVKQRAKLAVDLRRRFADTSSREPKGRRVIEPEKGRRAKR